MALLQISINKNHIDSYRTENFVKILKSHTVIIVSIDTFVEDIRVMDNTSISDDIIYTFSYQIPNFMNMKGSIKTDDLDKIHKQLCEYHNTDNIVIIPLLNEFDFGLRRII